MSDNPKRKLSPMLAISLTVNIFAFGLIGGALVMSHQSGLFLSGSHHAPPIRSFMNPRHLLEKASPETRHRLREVARQNLHDLRPELKKVHEARKVVHDLLREKELDREAIVSAISELAEAERNAQIASGETLILMLDVLSPEEREQLLQHSGRPDHKRDERHRRDFERLDHQDRGLGKRDPIDEEE